MIQNGQFCGLTDAALIERRKGVGGSDQRRVQAGEWHELWLDKLGEAKPRKIMSDWNRALRDRTETLQLDWYEHLGGGPVTRRGEVAVSRNYPFMRCTLDGWVEKLGVPINAKHLSKWTKEAREWAIEHYTPGAVHEAIVTEADYALLSLLHGEKEPEIIRIDCDPLFAVQVIVKTREFWGYVERREPPPDTPAAKVPMLAEDIAKLRTLLFDTMPEAERPNWYGDFLKFASVFAGTEAAAKKHAIARKDLAALIPEDVGLVRLGLFEAKRDGRGLTLALKKGNDDA